MDKPTDRQWTPAEDERLHVMVTTALAWELIADGVGRTVEAVKARAIELGIAPPKS